MEIEAEGHGDIVVKLVTIDVVCRKGRKVFRQKKHIISNKKSMIKTLTTRLNALKKVSGLG